MENLKQKTNSRQKQSAKVDIKNRLIFGDNLTALRRLLNDKLIAGNIRLIYIDPPFATNQEFTWDEERTSTISRSNGNEVAYRDNLIGDNYLNFLQKRLVLLREILADDGSIYVHIDYKIGHYVKVMMDKIFGKERFINDITRIKCNPKNFERRGFGNIKDLILFYSKNKNYIWKEQREQWSKNEINKLYPKIDKKDGRRYTTTPLHAPGETANGVTGQSWKGIKPPIGRHWRYKPEKLSRLDAAGLIEWSSTNNPRLKIYADEAVAKGKKRQDIWEFKDPPYPEYPTEKNLDMLELIIESSSNPGDIVLDCFAGSGTTLVAAQKLNRHWIGIDNSQIAMRIIKRRLSDYYDLFNYNDIIYEVQSELLDQ